MAKSGMDRPLLDLQQIFPHVRTVSAHLSILWDSHPPETALEIAVNYILENGLPGANNEGEASTSASNTKNGALQRGEFADTPPPSSGGAMKNQEPGDAQLYEDWCVFRLGEDFPRITLSSLRDSLRFHDGNLLRSYISANSFNRRARAKGIAKSSGNDVSSAVPNVLPGDGKIKPDLTVFTRRPPSKECPRFENDWIAVQINVRKAYEVDEHSVVDKAEEAFPYDECSVSSDAAEENLPVQPTFDPAKRRSPGEEENFDIDEFSFVESPGDGSGGRLQPTEELVECGCCCLEFDFEKLIQCSDGHLFCPECLRRHLEGYIFGGTRAYGLPSCMHIDGCDKTFPWTEMEKALPADVLAKYEQRQAEDAVARAKLEGLIYCPFCNHPWEVDRGASVLYCHNEACRKASCIKCKEPNHYPKRCQEVEKKSETSMRRKVEELMTKALIRECISCRAELVKTDGCNKVTCRCGQTMCYICRKVITNYSHFCQHNREEGKPCKLCSGCSLWEKENEEAVVNAAKQAAMQEVKAKEPGLLKRDIGPSDTQQNNKKRRTDGRR